MPTEVLEEEEEKIEEGVEINVSLPRKKVKDLPLLVYAFSFVVQQH